ncbi:2-dehydropantoate 2-reductase [Exiguobacterium sp. 17-1]|uniref:ketopantoate reductase family protein n=1 Tax=Exiguobacterium sp. 17-1 TaxID=2931981 RepID=UPI001FFF2DF8|nr:2-dehydropantoate 2-reductase [Exiguobacterium sp. 17-1]MCK2156810.1 2-dehydropantoate 2-reductase [Exiguobacterium sp. 17-1]
MSNIGIIGAGSIGLLIASYLAEQHHVTLYTRQTTGHDITILRDDQVSRPVEVRPLDQFESQDLVFVTTKSYDIKSVMPYLTSGEMPVMFLQNGMGHVKETERVQHALFGIVEHGAMRTGQYAVRHTGMGRIRYGRVPVPMLEATPLQFEYVPNIEQVMLTKLFMNAVINPLTAYYGIPNGQLLDSPYAEKAHGIFEELRNVFPEHPISYEEIEQVIRRTALNRSSMLQDLERGRQTEIEPIVGFVLEHAVNPTPLLTFYFHQIKSQEKRGDSM